MFPSHDRRGNGIIEAERGYAPQWTYVLFQHNGNTKEANKELVKLGYGKYKDPELTIDFDPLGDFPSSLLPVQVQELLGELEDSYNFAPQVVFTNLITCFAGLIGNLYGYDNGKWKGCTNLFIINVGYAGSKKTPTQQTITEPIELIESENYQNHKEQLKDLARKVQRNKEINRKIKYHKGNKDKAKIKDVCEYIEAVTDYTLSEDEKALASKYNKLPESESEGLTSPTQSRLITKNSTHRS